MKMVRFSFLILLVTFSAAFAQRSSTSAPVLVVHTEPKAIVWIDEIRRGTTDDAGALSITKLSPGRHTLRVRAAGFKEVTTPLVPGRKSVTVKLVTTTDEAELTFQQAEAARESAREDAAKEKAADLYRDAIKLRPSYAAA